MRYPDIEIELSITDRLVDLIAEHADVTIRAGHISDMALTARKIVDFERTICAAPAYLSDMAFRERQPTSRTMSASSLLLRRQNAGRSVRAMKSMTSRSCRA